MIAEAEIDRFQADGVLPLFGLFRDWVAPLREGIDAAIAAPSTRERSYRPADGTAMFFQDYCNWARIASFRRFVFESPAAAVAARLMRSRTARFFHDHVLVKEPGSSVPTPWHQDQPYYCVEGRQSVSFWIALDEVARDSVVEYVAGSHRWGRDFRPLRFNGTPLYPNDDFAPLPDIESQRAEHRILGWDMAPGDAVAFDFRTVHGAPGNRSAFRRRRAFSARWVGDDAIYVDRGGTTSPPFPDLQLADGAPLEGPDFPLVYRG